MLIYKRQNSHPLSRLCCIVLLTYATTLACARAVVRSLRTMASTKNSPALYELRTRGPEATYLHNIVGVCPHKAVQRIMHRRLVAKERRECNS